MSDFLLGRMGTNALVQAAPNTLDMEQTYLGLYAQDTWRVGPRVTLNYGLRWEPFFPQQLVNGAVYQFDMDAVQAATSRARCFRTDPAGLYFPGDPGFPSQGRHADAVEEFRAARRTGVGSDRQRQDLDPGVVRQVVTSS